MKTIRNNVAHTKGDVQCKSRYHDLRSPTEKIITLLKGHELEPMAQKPHLWLKGTPPNTRMVDMSVSPPQVCVFDGHNRLEDGHGIQELDIIKEQIGNILQIKDEGKTDVSKPPKKAKKESKNEEAETKGEIVTKEAVVEVVAEPIVEEGVPQRYSPSPVGSNKEITEIEDKHDKAPTNFPEEIIETNPSQVVESKPVKKHLCSECKVKITPEQAGKSFGEFDCLICQECIDIRNGVTPKETTVEVVGETTPTTGMAAKGKPTGLVSSDVNLKEIVTQESILKYLCPEATTKEAYIFMQLCHGRGLNPFLNEAYLVKFPSKNGKPAKATMIVGKDAFTRKAEESGKFAGFEAGIIIADKEKGFIEREGTLLLKGEELIGGWAKVYRNDMERPFVSKVNLADFDKQTNNWETMKPIMIRKVPMCQAFREAFTSELGGCYDSAEMTDKLEQE